MNDFKTILRVAFWPARQTVHIVKKWRVDSLPGIKDGIAKWAQTLLIYTMLGTMILLISMLPLPLWSKVVWVLAMSLLLSSVTVVRTKMRVSEKDMKDFEKDNRQLRDERERLQAEMERLKRDIQNQSTRILDMNWIWEMNFAEIRKTETKPFDYFMRVSEKAPVRWESPRLWENSPEEIMEGDFRVIGALKIDYTYKIGVDLRQILVHYDSKKKIAEYWLPEFCHTISSPIEASWPIRVSMCYAKGQGIFADTDWRLFDDEIVTLSVWEDVKKVFEKDLYEKTSLDDQLCAGLKHEIELKLQSFFEDFVGCEARSVRREQIAEPTTLRSLVQKMQEGRVGLPML